MVESTVKTIRASETVAPYGPGAIVDILGQSFMVPTGDKWPSQKVRERVDSSRLADALHVQELWAAPTTHEPEKGTVPGLEFVRFPGWLFCQVCRRLVKWSPKLETGRAPHCAETGCDGRLVPMRFVLVCTENSHLGDVPWGDWAHRGSEGDCRSSERLRFRTLEGVGDGLSSLQVSCDACGAKRSLGELRRDALAKDGFSCRGTQPWENEWTGCGKPVDAQQRGATSLHFSDSVSAIDIPPVPSRASDKEDAIRGHGLFDSLGAAVPALRDGMVAQMVTDLGVSVEEIEALVDDAGPVERREIMSTLQSDEFEAFVRAVSGTAPMQDFVTRPIKLHPTGEDASDGVAARIQDVVLVDRLRDVRAVRGFRRYSPEATAVPAVPTQSFEKSWLPAAEGYGEGIFIRFDAAAVEEWAAQPAVRTLEETLLEHQNHSTLGLRLHVVSAEYVLLHSFAHLLMRELAFSSGYTASSLRERVYCEDAGDYGVFIYTTTADVEGTLGGLVRQGERDLLVPAIVAALEQAAWCPNDPVCAESEPQSIDGLNLAACHACSLAPETSCESSNLLLDRTFVVGGEKVVGFFGPVLDALLGQRIG
ncbi:DrmB family protein [Microbacterium sp. NPDC088619]|uniref:DrmB family protein n=1 Tax=Microbacterium sp. NPDC088619 TaxID=3364196 RepID=UPI003807503F